MIERHRLDITRPGRGVVFAMCSCGHKHIDARNGRDPSAFPAHGTVTDARIRAISPAAQEPLQRRIRSGSVVTLGPGIPSRTGPLRAINCLLQSTGHAVRLYIETMPHRISPIRLLQRSEAPGQPTGWHCFPLDSHRAKETIMPNYTPCAGTGQPTTDRRVMHSDSPRFFHLNGKVTGRCGHCDKPVRLSSMRNADNAAPMHKSARMADAD